MFNLFKRKKDQKKDFSAAKVFREGFSKRAKYFRTADSTPEKFKKLGYPAWAVKQMGFSDEEMKEGGYKIKSK